MTPTQLLQWPGQLLVAAMVLTIKTYQWTIAPLLGPCCRFEPSCSRYTIEALRKYGPILGLAKGIWRILRCHPWSPGGVDPP